MELQLLPLDLFFIDLPECASFLHFSITIFWSFFYLDSRWAIICRSVLEFQLPLLLSLSICIHVVADVAISYMEIWEMLSKERLVPAFGFKVENLQVDLSYFTSGFQI